MVQVFIVGSLPRLGCNVGQLLEACWDLVTIVTVRCIRSGSASALFGPSNHLLAVIMYFDQEREVSDGISNREPVKGKDLVEFEIKV